MSVFSAADADLGLPLPFLHTVADPRMSTRLHILLTVLTLHPLSGYAATIDLAPSLCSRNVWILSLSSNETFPITITLKYPFSKFAQKHQQINKQRLITVTSANGSMLF